MSPQDNAVERLGILAMDLEPDLIQLLGGLRDPNGVLVAAPLFQLASLSGGFMPGDVIHAVNGQPIGSLSALRGVVNELSRGDACVVEVERQGQLRYLTFEIDD